MFSLIVFSIPLLFSLIVFSVPLLLFLQVIPFDLLSLFTADEFSLLINGVCTIDVEDWRKNTEVVSANVKLIFSIT